MSLSILETYRKDLIRQPGEGYGRRTGGVWAAQRPGPPTSVVIHATHGKPGTRSEAEAEFLRGAAPGDIWAEALMLRLGRRIAVCDVRLWTESPDRLAAQATVTYAIPSA